MTQYQAGYILDSINEILKEKMFSSNRVTGLLKYLSCFDLEINTNTNKKSEDSSALVIHNLISKGIPTRPSIYIEKQFMNAFGKAQIDTSDITEQIGNIKFLSNFTDYEKKDLMEMGNVEVIEIREPSKPLSYSIENASDLIELAIAKFFKNRIK